MNSLLPHLFPKNILLFFSLFYPSKHVTCFSVLMNSKPKIHFVEVISFLIYHYLSIISNLGFSSLIEILPLLALHLHERLHIYIFKL